MLNQPPNPIGGELEDAAHPHRGRPFRFHGLTKCRRNSYTSLSYAAANARGSCDAEGSESTVRFWCVAEKWPACSYCCIR